jgi:hypothetical protein
MITNLAIFMLSYSLNGSQFSMGAAFGLFAVFGMLRFRMEDISIRDMTYLFLTISLSRLNVKVLPFGALGGVAECGEPQCSGKSGVMVPRKLWLIKA